MRARNTKVSIRGGRVSIQWIYVSSNGSKLVMIEGGYDIIVKIKVVIVLMVVVAKKVTTEKILNV